MTRATREIHAILAIAYRDVLKFVREPSRFLGPLILSVVFVGILGGSFQSNLGKNLGYNFLTFILTGMFAHTLFQYTASGISSLIEDREKDFTQEIFISPISRYSIVFGKILGESLAALLQGISVLAFGIVIGIHFTVANLLAMIPIAIVICLLGGAFGLAVLSGFGSQRAASQFGSFLIFPQFFTAGVFSPIRHLPWYLDFLSKISPLRYAVDLARGVFYSGQAEYGRVVLAAPFANLTIMIVMCCVFLFVGTVVFVRSECNK